MLGKKWLGRSQGIAFGLGGGGAARGKREKEEEHLEGQFSWSEHEKAS